MLVIEGRTMEEAYINAVRKVMLYGETVSPRGSETKEIAPATIVVEDARRFLAAPPTRKINPCFGLAETLWFLRGSDDLEEIAHYNSVWRFFEDCDNKGVLNGAYGKRLRNWDGIDQLEEVYKKLKKDPYSRQSIAVIFDPVRDNKIHCHGGYSKDIPCTSLFNFQIRNNKLNMNVVMRSNDLHKGFIYDAHNFMIIQNILAGWLEVEVGKYEHTALSLHIYESDYDKMWEMITEDDKFSIYEGIDNLPSMAVNKEEFDSILKTLNFIEKKSRKLSNSNIPDEIMLVNKFNELIKTAEKEIKNDFWLSAAVMLIIYNVRKSKKVPKIHYENSIKYFISPEYKKLFLQLSDLSDKK